MNTAHTAENSTGDSPFITAPELRDLIKSDANVRIFDCTYHPPTVKRNSATEFEERHIPTSQFFDIDAIADRNSKLPHMLPPEAEFETAMQDFGVNQDTLCVFYDVYGLFSAARGWWMCRAFGHENVKILAGGLQEWEDHSFPTDFGAETPVPIGNFIARHRPNLVATAEDVLEIVQSGRGAVIDARKPDRYNGIVDEPRRGLRKGHYPRSHNLPFADLLTEDKILKSHADLSNVFLESGVNPRQRRIITACGSGVSACVVALALYVLGNRTVSVYDGSWAEWGADNNLPIAQPMTINVFEMISQEKPAEFPTQAMHDKLEPKFSGLTVTLADDMPLHFYRYLYWMVGEQYKWWQRRLWTDRVLSDHIHTPDTGIYVLYIQGNPAGFVHLTVTDSDVGRSVAIEQFGIMGDYADHARELAPYLFSYALEQAWRQDPTFITGTVNDLEPKFYRDLYAELGFSVMNEQTITTDDPQDNGILDIDIQHKHNIV